MRLATCRLRCFADVQLYVQAGCGKHVDETVNGNEVDSALRWPEHLRFLEGTGFSPYISSLESAGF
jgi:hypothetical protein